MAPASKLRNWYAGAAPGYNVNQCGLEVHNRILKYYTGNCASLGNFTRGVADYLGSQSRDRDPELSATAKVFERSPNCKGKWEHVDTLMVSFGTLVTFLWTLLTFFWTSLTFFWTLVTFFWTLFTFF